MLTFDLLRSEFRYHIWQASFLWYSICVLLLYQHLPPSSTFFVNTSRVEIGSSFGFSLWTLKRSAISLGLTFGNMAEYCDSSSMADFFNPSSMLTSRASSSFLVAVSSFSTEGTTAISKPPLLFEKGKVIS